MMDVDISDIRAKQLCSEGLKSLKLSKSGLGLAVVSRSTTALFNPPLIWLLLAALSTNHQTLVTVSLIIRKFEWKIKKSVFRTFEFYPQ